MKKKILVVDDEASLTRMVKMNLERTGNYEVRTENEGANALAAAREFKPDLVLLDVMMPDMSGDDVAAQLREEPDLAGTRYIFVTAIVTQAETGDSASDIGGNTFLAKPIKTDKLIEAIESALAN